MPLQRLDMITSSHSPKIQLVRTLLGRSKERRSAGAFVAEGVRLVEEALFANWPFKFVLAGQSLGGRGKELLAQLQSNKVAVESVSDDLLHSLSETETTQGILAVLDYVSLPVPNSLSFVLILDQIRDPGNLGTLLRTAAAAGVQAVLLPPETADAFAPKVIRAGMGAHFRLPILSLPWNEISIFLKGLQIHLAEIKDATTCWQADFRPPLALIIGGEAGGASQPARDLATSRVTIPMSSKTESLNAAVAGAILLFEVVRQRSGR
jgi:TrmH family RNA methyltransferase